MVSGMTIFYDNQHCNEAEMLKEIDTASELLKNRILTALDKTNFTGRIWYISPDGKKDNKGDCPDCPWDSLDTLMENSGLLAHGDTVLLQRGRLYRGQIIAVDGVYYGAYGEGDKPVIYGSIANYAEYEWVNVGGNIWRLEHQFRWDAGFVAINNGEHIGFNKRNKSDLKNDFDFWCDREDGLKLYMYYSSDFNFESIEIGENVNIIDILVDSNDVVIENLSLRYGGSHGIRCRGNNKNITVRGCEVSFLGGSYLVNYKDGTTRFGNGVEFWRGCQNILVESCWIHDIYDSGISHQGAEKFVQRNITYRNNLIENCGMGSIEYWLSYRGEEILNYAENIEYFNNIMRFAGYGFGGEQRPDKDKSAHIQSNGPNQNHYVNYTISGNIFYASKYDLLEISSLNNTFPNLSGNTYIQKTGNRLGTFAESKNVFFNREVQEIIKKDWGDKNAVVIFL